MASPRCGVCKSPDVKLIDRALLSGTSARAVAQAYSLGRGAISRHQRHLRSSNKPAAIKQQAEALVAVDALAETEAIDLDGKDAVYTALARTHQAQWSMYLRCLAVADTRGAARALSDSATTLSLFAKMYGLYSDGVTVNLNERAEQKILRIVNDMSEDDMRSYISAVTDTEAENARELALEEHLEIYRPKKFDETIEN